MTPRLTTRPIGRHSVVRCAVREGGGRGSRRAARSYHLPSGGAATTLNQFAGASGRPSRVIADVTVRF